MATDLTFKEVCKFIREDDHKLIERADVLLGTVLVLSPFALGLPALPLPFTLGLLGTKNELTKIGKYIFEKLTGKKSDSSFDKEQRMEAAYCLICYTAFFAALEDFLPEVKKELALKLEEKRSIVKAALAKLGRREGPEFTLLDNAEPGIEEFKLFFPHPADDFNGQTKQLRPLYEQLSKGLAGLIGSLDNWAGIPEENRQRTLEKVKKLPEIALANFRAQYFDLATRYDEFYVWSNLQEHEKTRGELSPQLEEILKLIKSGNKGVDLGFQKLGDLINSIPQLIEEEKVEKVFTDIINIYQSTLEEPILQAPDKRQSQAIAEGILVADDIELSYPKKSEIFVPQSFKAIRYSGSEQLEDKVTWSNVESRDDLGIFLYSYLSSPYSSRTPLIILGHPGSGKSLLTHVLAARLTPPLLTPIRVELRDVNADNDIPLQIEEQIHKDTNREVKWATLADHFKGVPPLIILDGYDELLQASGKVFADYLKKVENFQLNETERLKRSPVRAIVTSRITLIDKAQIPRGATIIQLEEFDDAKQKKWISVWNKANTQYYKRTGIEKFEVPNDGKIKALAEQPLLLLMLALYDSQSNELRRKKGLDRTALYDSLIRRFIEREIDKKYTFRLSKGDKGREALIEDDMERLGVAALGMFNRRSLSIHAEELNTDVSFFGLTRDIPTSPGRKLSQADLLLGSFFFIHEAKSGRKSGYLHESGTDSAFEFLHNTFGEFLTTDFILRRVLSETQKLYKYRNDDFFKPQLERSLAGQDEFPEQWFASLMYTPLYSRPVILAMMREWLSHKLIKAGRALSDFILDLDTIVTAHLNRVIAQSNFPLALKGNLESSTNKLPLLGHLATYSINLILLRTVLSPNGYEFDEGKYVMHDSDNSESGHTKAWDRLTFLWRSWFSMDSLHELSAVITAFRFDNKIRLVAREDFAIPTSIHALHPLMNVASTLADNSMFSIAGLVAYDSYGSSSTALNLISDSAHSGMINLDPEIMVERLKLFIRIRPTQTELEHVIRDCIVTIRNAKHVKQEVAVDVLALINRCTGNSELRADVVRVVDEIFADIMKRGSLGEIAEALQVAYDTGYEAFYEWLLRHLEDNNLLEQIELASLEARVKLLELLPGRNHRLFEEVLLSLMRSTEFEELHLLPPHVLIRLAKQVIQPSSAISFPAGFIQDVLQRLVLDFDPITLDRTGAKPTLELLQVLRVAKQQHLVARTFERLIDRPWKFPDVELIPFLIIIAYEIGYEKAVDNLFSRYAELIENISGQGMIFSNVFPVYLPLDAMSLFIKLARQRGLTFE